MLCSSIAKGTNNQVVEYIKPDILLQGKITTFYLTYFNHVMKSNSLEKAILLGVVNSTVKGNEATRYTMARHHANPQQPKHKATERSCTRLEKCGESWFIES